jgi:excinuclease ABC subunit A
LTRSATGWLNVIFFIMLKLYHDFQSVAEAPESGYNRFSRAPVAQRIERQPSKLRVGSSSLSGRIYFCANSEQAGMEKNIVLRGIRTNNLKNIDAAIPLGKITALVGVSGAGKSSLAFHTLYAEGYIRYIESISPYIRQFLDRIDKPDIDHIENLPPAIAFRLKKPVKNPRSIVATAADIFDYLRILYAKIADFYCPGCGKQIKKFTIDEIIQVLLARKTGQLQICFAYQGDISFLINRGYYFQMDKGRKKAIDGRSRNLPILVLVDELENRSENRSRLFEAVDNAMALSGNTITVFHDRRPLHFPVIFFCPGCRQGYENPDENLFSFNSARGACPACKGLGVASETGPGLAFCQQCGGSRFNRLALSFRIEGRTIADFLAMTIGAADALITTLDRSSYHNKISHEVFEEIAAKLQYLLHSRMHYMHLNRPTFTLSRGEYQRINLAFIMGSTLSDSLLIIDQPSADLHPADYEKMDFFLKKLKENGNTIVLVEHNPRLVRFADHVLELGPRAGVEGGQIIYAGSKDDFFSSQTTITQKCFRPAAAAAIAKTDCSRSWTYKNAGSHNLKHFDFQIPRQAFTVIVGVSGAGKSTLLYDEIYLRQQPASGSAEIVYLDPGSGSRRGSTNVAAFFDIFPMLREFYAAQKQSRLLGYLPGHFSFNSPLGRCPECKGRGYLEIEMQFLPAVKSICAHCHGNGFNPDILKIAYKKMDIAAALNLTINEFVGEFGPVIPQIQAILENLRDNDMGYLQLGEKTSCLSTGELQKLKLLKYLNQEKKDAVFLLDEPSFGLHPYDIEVIKKLFSRLLKNRNTIVAVEHNLSLIASADHVIELGPEGGDGGGYMLFSGTPEAMMQDKKSLTGKYLKNYLKNT